MAGYILYSSPDEEKNKELEALEEQIKEDEGGLQEEYRKLGEAYFEQNELELEVPAEFSELFDAIRERKAVLEQCKGRIMSLKKIKICPYCESEIPEESVFCIMCGKKVKETKPQKLENTVTCKYCGTVLPAGSKFCGYCAHSLSDDTAAADLLEDTFAENTENKQKSKEKVQLKKNLDSTENRFESNTFEEESFEDESFENETVEANSSEDLEEESFEKTIGSDPFENRIFNRSMDTKTRFGNESYDNDAGDESYDTDIDGESYDNNTDDEFDEEEDDLYATTAANTGWNAIKICPRCNKKLDSSSKFCTGCGMRLSD